MSKLWHEIRLYLHAVMLDWALRVMPDGKDRVEFATAVEWYLRRTVARGAPRTFEYPLDQMPFRWKDRT